MYTSAAGVAHLLHTHKHAGTSTNIQAEHSLTHSLWEPTDTRVRSASAAAVAHILHTHIHVGTCTYIHATRSLAHSLWQHTDTRVHSASAAGVAHLLHTHIRAGTCMQHAGLHTRCGSTQTHMCAPQVLLVLHTYCTYTYIYAHTNTHRASRRCTSCTLMQRAGSRMCCVHSPEHACTLCWCCTPIVCTNMFAHAC